MAQNIKFQKYHTFSAQGSGVTGEEEVGRVWAWGSGWGQGDNVIWTQQDSCHRAHSGCDNTHNLYLLEADQIQA